MSNDANAPDFTDVVAYFDELGIALFGEEDEPTDFAEGFLDLEREKTPQEAFKNLRASVCRYFAALENKLDDKDREIVELRRGLERAEEKLGPLMILAAFASGIAGWWIVTYLDFAWLVILLLILFISSKYWFHRKKP